ncbi:G-type lectin S-receptor-like serine/threonine-protein kinase At4g27290 [Lactuca sativa]|uniref:G-type lectin S-receptor-like serine/threonine-protein kinase At4g27290 n=1 Tax=Lactuca sativa TaxID=4236 RepID=UPI0022AFA653|nr:G-type lectin S-receptor-like serine/threonine-protein kinase At4g27290 [Lactuca sativa]
MSKRNYATWVMNMKGRGSEVDCVKVLVLKKWMRVSMQCSKECIPVFCRFLHFSVAAIEGSRLGASDTRRAGLSEEEIRGIITIKVDEAIRGFTLELFELINTTMIERAGPGDSFITLSLCCSPVSYSFILSCSAALDRVYINQPIKVGNTIVSDGETYELGFISPGKSKNRYLGIWYKNISPCTVVRVANRQTPIKDASGVFELTTEGILQIYIGGNNVTWSSNGTSVFARNMNPVAQLLDTGNLVVWDERSNNENPIWQSFDYPGDTLLPGMKFGKDLITGRERFLTS